MSEKVLELPFNRIRLLRANMVVRCFCAAALDESPANCFHELHEIN